MVKNDYEERQREFMRLKYFMGFGLFVFMFIIHVFFVEFHISLFAVPASIIGLLPEHFIKK